MAGPVLGALLRLDTKQFDDPLKKAGTNVRDFAKNMKAAQAVINQTATAEEKFAAGQKRLIGLHQQGLLTLRQYTTATAHLRNELGILTVQQQASARAAVQQEAAMKRAALASREMNAVARIRNNAAIMGRTAAAERRNNFLYGAGNLGAVGSRFGLTAGGLGLLGVGVGGGLAIGKSVGAAADAQSTFTSFRTMLGGNRGAANTLLGRIDQTAATTPFSRVELRDSAQKMLAFGFAADDIIPRLRRLGDIASGLNLNLGELTELYGITSVEGKLMTKDLRQFTTRGIDILTPLAKQFGTTKEGIFDLAEEGKISFGELEKALQSLTGPGGTFFNLMAAKSKEIKGQWSNLGDLVSKFAERVGSSALPALDAVLQRMQRLTPGYAEQQRNLFGETLDASVQGVGGLAGARARASMLRGSIARAEYGIRNVDRAIPVENLSPAIKQVMADINAMQTALKREESRLHDFALKGRIANRLFAPKPASDLGDFLRGQAEATRNAETARALSSLIGGRARDTIDLPDHPRFQFRGLGALGLDGRRKGLRFADDLPASQSPEFLTRGSGGAFSAITAAANYGQRQIDVASRQLQVMQDMRNVLTQIFKAGLLGNANNAALPELD